MSLSGRLVPGFSNVGADMVTNSRTRRDQEMAMAPDVDSCKNLCTLGFRRKKSYG